MPEKTFPPLYPKRITRAYFTEATGEKPVQDDLERSNCKKAGQPGHYSCGWCFDCNKPNFQCGCLTRKALAK